MSAAQAEAQAEALALALRRVLPDGLAIGWADPRLADPRLADLGQAAPVWPGEAIAAVPKRRTEFAAGRMAARAAMAELGLDAAAIPMAADRAPVWPDGVTGSISHSASACLAIVGRSADWRGIGLDIEPATPLPQDLWPAVLAQDERAALGENPGLRAKLIFTAKEAAYKAQYPQSRALFGFETLRIRLGPADFTATFTAAVPPFAMGQRLQGLHLAAAGHLASLVLMAA